MKNELQIKLDELVKRTELLCEVLRRERQTSDQWTQESAGALTSVEAFLASLRGEL